MSPEEKNGDFIRRWFDSPFCNIFNLEEKYKNTVITCSSDIYITFNRHFYPQRITNEDNGGNQNQQKSNMQVL